MEGRGINTMYGGQSMISWEFIVLFYHLGLRIKDRPSVLLASAFIVWAILLTLISGILLYGQWKQFCVLSLSITSFIWNACKIKYGV